MNSALALVYEGAARLAHALSSVVPPSRNKLLATFAERRGVLARFASFTRDSSRPLLWMHAPSVGEGLQARPVLQLARTHRPDVQLAYTYFSPSARAFAASLNVDFRDSLPFDATPDVRAALDALVPSALVFSKLDVWPTLVRESSARGTRLGLISATLAGSSSRRSPIASSLLRGAYARLERVGAISAEDADRLISLGVPAARISVTGDTRYDQVWARAQGVKRDSELLTPHRFTVVAGSTWPADEARLLPAWSRLARHHASSRPRLIIAPHEPTPAHLAAIERWAAGEALHIARLSDPTAPAADVVLVDRLGVLGDLYSLADAAFVGGGFHAAGLHSVLEPAAFGVPVLFGPRHHGSRDATLLLDADAAESAADARELERALERWITHADERCAMGAAARTVVHGGLGAAERSWKLVQELLA